MKYTDACDVLGLPNDQTLTDNDLKKAFKRAALKHHPDKNFDNPEEAKEIFQQVNAAYNFLLQCVARGQTGPSQPRHATADTYEEHGDHGAQGGSNAYYDYYYDDDDDDNYGDGMYANWEDILFGMWFDRAQHRNNGYYGRHSAGVFNVSGGIFMGGGHPRSSFSSGRQHSYASNGNNKRRYYEEEESDDEDDDLDDMFERMAEQARRKEEARQKARQKQEEHAKYMAERARQAELEGRDFFESWNIKQLKGECQRRGISTNKLQQKDIIEALIADEAQKRLREQLKQEAPLLDEWAEVIHMQHRPEMNGTKVRVIDFFDDKYTVEWDPNAAKKKSKGHQRDSRKARVKPSNLRLWGTGEPLDSSSSNNNNNNNKNPATAGTSTSDKENFSDGNTSNGSSKGKNKNKNTNAKSSTTTKKPASEPEVPKTKCCAVCHKEHDLDAAPKEDAASSSKSVILPCAHIFCSDCCGGSYLPDPTSTVLIRACRVCNKVDPGVEALKQLPYVVDLRDPPEALLESIYKEYSLIVTCDNVVALQKQHKKELDNLDSQKTKLIKSKKDVINKKNSSKEKKGKLIKQMLAKVEEEFEPKRKEIVRKHAMLWRSVADQAGEKVLQSKRDATTEEVTKAINKHFRKASIKVHPDRHGSKYQKEFDALTKARDSLTATALRHKYIEQMMQIVGTVGTHWVKSSHEAWVKQHQPDMAEQNPSTKKADEPGNKKPLQIEGGMMHRKPKKPQVQILNAGERRVRLTLRVPGGSWFEFMAYCQAVTIMGERTLFGNEGEYSKVIYKDNFGREDSDIVVELTLPEPGLWDIRWLFTTELDGGEVDCSEESWDATVDLVSPKYKSQLKVMQTFEELAKRRARDIHEALRKLNNKKADSSHSKISSRHDMLQEAILRGKQVEHHLEKAMKKLGVYLSAANTPLSTLRSALAEAVPFKAEIDAAMATHTKKVAFKNFKHQVYDILETGDAHSWIATVAKETLKDEMKGDANRLYQLLMEGRKAYHIELVDAATLFSAAERKDIFTPKQLASLSQRAEEVEIRAAEEAHRSMIEAEKREKDELTRKSIEEAAESVGVSRGQMVKLQGLKSKPELNGRLATFMGLAASSPSRKGTSAQRRYIVRLLNDGHEFSLKKHNFSKWNGVGEAKFGPTEASNGSTTWACNACTYVHDCSDAGSLASCSICDTPRTAKSKASVQPGRQGSSKASPKSQVANLKQSKVEKVTKPKRSQLQSKPSPTAATPVKAPELQSNTPATSAFGDDETYSTYAKTNESSSVKSTADNSKDLGVNGTADLVNKVDSGELLHNMPPRNAQKCRFGRRCKYFKNGGCKYQHSAEDVAFAMGKVQAATPLVPAQTIRSKKGSPETLSTMTQSPQQFGRSDPIGIDQTIDVDADAVGMVIGRGGQVVQKLQHRSGTKIKVDRSAIVNGKICVHIHGPDQQAVDTAISLIQDIVGHAPTKPPRRHEDAASVGGNHATPVPSVIVNDGGDPNQSCASSLKDVQQPPVTSGNTGGSDLSKFIHSYKKFIKGGASDQYLEWLRFQDIETMEDLVLACEDDEFISKLVEAGLKRFKLAAFSKSVFAYAKKSEAIS